MSQPPPDPGFPPRPHGRLQLRLGALGVAVVVLFMLLVLRLWALQVLNTRTFVAQAAEQPREAGRRARAARRDPRPQGPRARAQPRRLRARPRSRRRARQRAPPPAAAARRPDARPRAAPAVGARRPPAAPGSRRARHARDGHRRASSSGTCRRTRPSSAASRVAQVPLRYYPYRTLGAHIYGQLSEIGPEQLKDPRFHDYHRGDVIGQSGVERRYDAFLRGIDGIDAVTVDAFGQPTGAVRHLKAPVPGRNVRLTIDLDTQRAAEQALAYGVRSNALGGRERGRAGGARPEERRGPRAGLVPDVRPELVHLVPQAEVPEPSSRASRARAASRAQLPAARPRHRGPLPRRLRVQAVRGDRGRQGAARDAEHAAALHARSPTTTTSASTTGTARSTGAST